jgi:hypothetical protein
MVTRSDKNSEDCAMLAALRTDGFAFNVSGPVVTRPQLMVTRSRPHLRFAVQISDCGELGIITTASDIPRVIEESMSARSPTSRGMWSKRSMAAEAPWASSSSPTAASSGRSGSNFTVNSFRRHRSGSLRGFARINIRELKMTVTHGPIHERDGSRRASPHSKSLIHNGAPIPDEEGQQNYAPSSSSITPMLNARSQIAIVETVIRFDPTALSTHETAS